MATNAPVHPAQVELARLFASDKLIGPPFGDEVVELVALLFEPDEAAVALHVPVLLQQPAERIARRARRPVAVVLPLLESAARKKVVHRGKKGYCLVPLLPGVYEKVLMDGQDTPFHREFARRMNALFAKGYMKDHIGSPTRTVRTIPVDRAVEGRSLRADEVRIEAMIDAHDELAVLTTCQCRQAAHLTGHDCRRGSAADGCLAFGSFARFFVEQGGARFVGPAEMRRLAQGRWDKGLVLFTGNVAPASPNLVCSCCDCCCQMLAGILLPRPGILVTAPRIRIEVDEALCTGCGLCAKACLTGAQRLEAHQHRYDPSLCVGCGQCLLACGDGAIGARSNDAFRAPPPSFGGLALRLTPAKIASLALGRAKRSPLGREVAGAASRAAARWSAGRRLP